MREEQKGFGAVCVRMCVCVSSPIPVAHRPTCDMYVCMCGHGYSTLSAHTVAPNSPSLAAKHVQGDGCELCKTLLHCAHSMPPTCNPLGQHAPHNQPHT